MYKLLVGVNEFGYVKNMLKNHFGKVPKAAKAEKWKTLK